VSKVLLFDIEATNLSANFGFMLSFGYKWLGDKKPTIVSIADFPHAFGRDCTNDKELVKVIAPVLNAADMWVTWYGERFDVPFVQTRRLLQGLGPVADRPHFDGWRVAKYRLRYTSNRLDTVSRSLPLDEDEVRKLKTPLEDRHWVRGAAGHRPSLEYIDKHCAADVEVLEQVYKKLRPFSASMPSLAVMDGVKGCPACGSERTQKRGFKATATTVRRQRQCQDCEHWFVRPLDAEDRKEVKSAK
jgi:uncharacterized protein YprB with RNaseH-like and TPR domain